MDVSRRSCLRGLAATTLSAATLGTLGSALSTFQSANAADVSGYKALVCVFLLGGADTHDVVLPYDSACYDKFSSLRASLISDYGRQSGGNSRARERLLALNPVNSADFEGRQFALPPEMSGIHALFEEGNAAIVANTGPLIQPLNREQWRKETVVIPKQLFSHNDQQSTWVASGPEGASFGWGGLFADAVAAAGANSNRDFTTITTLGNELFLTGRSIYPYQIGEEGAFEIELLNRFGGDPFYESLHRHFSAADIAPSNLIQQDVARIAKNSVELNETFNRSLENLIPVNTAFPQNSLGKQLKAIANAIAIRDSLFMQRQVFFAATGGFDTHSRQAATLPQRLAEVDGAVTAFYRAMQELGLGNSVTLFTASDFGRTLAVNGDGTDHGWGSHHIVVGNAVSGKTIYGEVPPAELGHSQDANGGRLIPTISVEQYAEPLGKWFGLSSAELNVALPNLKNFTTKQQLSEILRA